MRRPAASTSISARLWRTASSTTWSRVTRPGRPAPRAGRRRGHQPAAATRPRYSAAPRVHLHDVALVEEERHLDHRAGLEGGGLRAARGGVAADAGIGLGDLQLDEVRQLDSDRAVVDEQDLHLGVLLEEVARLADFLGGEGDLIVRVEVHEVVAVVLVEELHPLLLEVDQLDLLARAERVVDDPAEPHVLELGAHERAALAGLDVLEVDDACTARRRTGSSGPS